MNRANVEQFLFGAGFVHTGSSGFAHTYQLDIGNGYKVDATASIADAAFFGPPADPTKIDRVGCNLDAGGTTYRFYSERALSTKLTEMIAELRRVSQNPDLLKCPECGIRNVHMIEPRPGAAKQFAPFLSCNGIAIERSGKRRESSCRGTSNKLPALINYK